MEILNIAKALDMLDGEKELLIELLNAFVDTKESEPFSLTKLISLEEANKEEAAKYVHFFKGAARQIGAEVLASSGQELEDVLRGKKTGDLESMNAKFQKDYKIAFDAIKEQVSIL